MKEAIDLVMSARALCEEIHTRLSAQAGSVNFPAIVAFNQCHQHATVCLELLCFYQSVWSKAQVNYGVLTVQQVLSVQQQKQENGERVMKAARILLIECLSSMEYCAKEARNGRELLLPCGKNLRVHLSNILRLSPASSPSVKRWISDEDARLWTGAIGLRNSLVHNNGIADEDEDFVYPDCILQMRRGQMTRGDLLLVFRICIWVVNAFERWCLEFLNRLARPGESTAASASSESAIKGTLS